MNRKEFIDKVINELKNKLQDWVSVESVYLEKVDSYDIKFCFKLNDSQYCLCFNECIFDKFYLPFTSYSSHNNIEYTEEDITKAINNIHVRANELIANLIWEKEH